MIIVQPIDHEVLKKIHRYNLRKKFEKQASLLVKDPRHPSLNVELLEPHSRGLFSFRIDRKFRAIFEYLQERNLIRILNITVHYH